MKTVRWVFGVAMLAGASLVALLATAATGDVVYIRANDEVTLNGTQKTKGATYATAEHNGIVIANVKKLYVRQLVTQGLYTNEFYDRICDIKTAANDSARVDAEEAGAEDPEAFGSGLDYADCRESSKVASKALLVDFVESWCASTLDKVVDLTVKRPNPATPTVVVGQCNSIVTASPATYNADRAAGKVIRRIGRVQ